VTILNSSPSPLAGEGGSRVSRETVEGVVPHLGCQDFTALNDTPHPALRATFSLKGRRGTPHGLMQ
jgi:hypothetical protein